MKSDPPWQITGLRPQAIEAACRGRRQEGNVGCGREGRSPGNLWKTVDDLRRDLADIDLMLGEALPESAIQALEGELHKLADHFDSRGHATVGVAAFLPIECKLADMRDALRALIPAESLSGVRQALQQLSHKLERVGGSRRDSATLHEIASVLAALRGIGSRVASSAVLAQLSEKLRCLAASIELIGTLTEKIMATDTALARLEAIEHKVASLDLECRRISSLARPTPLPPLPNVDALAREVSDLRQVQRQTQDSLEAVHGSLGDAIDRLAMIETEMRSGSSPRNAATAPTAASRVPAAAAMAAGKGPATPQIEGAAANGPQTPAPAEQARSDPHSADANPLPDPPIASPSGLPRTRNPGSPAERVLGSDTASAEAGPSIASGSKLDFIAAARRAVQATADRQVVAKNHVSVPAEIASAGGGLARRVRILGALIGAIAVVLMLFGSLQIARTLRSSSTETSASASGPTAATQRPTPLAPPASAVAQHKLSAIERLTPDLATAQPGQ
jgi:localization factor PodJL